MLNARNPTSVPVPAPLLCGDLTGFADFIRWTVTRSGLCNGYKGGVRRAACHWGGVFVPETSRNRNTGRVTALREGAILASSMTR